MTCTDILILVIKFKVPSADPSGHIFTRDHHVALSTTFDALIESIRTVSGLNIVKEHEQPKLGIHFTKDLKARVYPLHDNADWRSAKGEWVNEVTKKKSEAAIELVYPPGVSTFSSSILCL